MRDPLVIKTKANQFKEKLLCVTEIAPLSAVSEAGYKVL